MSVRRLDKNHDWTFGQGKQNYAIKSEAIAQTVKCRILSFKNDWFLNTEHGIAWFDFMEKGTNLDLVKSELISAVLDVDEVEEITNYNATLNRETRKFTAQITYRDIYKNEQLIKREL